jgi:hypothetical protein
MTKNNRPDPTTFDELVNQVRDDIRPQIEAQGRAQAVSVAIVNARNYGIQVPSEYMGVKLPDIDKAVARELDAWLNEKGEASE